MGWNGSGSGKAVEPPKPREGGGVSPSVVKGALGGFLVIVAALAVFTFFRGGSDMPKMGAKQGKKQIAAKAPVVKAEQLPAAKKTRQEEAARSGFPKEQTKKRVVDELERLEKAIVADFRVDPSQMKAIFTNDVLCQLQMYSKYGVDMPPPDPVSDEEARAAIKEGVYIMLDDPPDVQAVKTRVHELLALLKDWMNDGGSANSFFAELEHEQEMASEASETVRAEIEEAKESGDIEGARKLAKGMNLYLEGKGIPPVAVKGVNSKYDVQDDDSNEDSKEETDK